MNNDFMNLIAEELERVNQNEIRNAAVPMSIEGGPQVTPMGEAPTADSVLYQGYSVPAPQEEDGGLFDGILGKALMMWATGGFSGGGGVG